MQRNKKSLLFVASAVFVLAIFIVLAGKQVSAKSERGNVTSSEKGQINAELHRSTVANFVQGLLNVADREKGGIGEQVRVVAKEQNESASATAKTIEKVEKRSKIKTFLFGSDYKNLGALRSEMVQTRNRINQLNRILENIQNASSTAELNDKIQALKQEQTKIENFVAENENKVSLFGWLFKLFNR